MTMTIPIPVTLASYECYTPEPTEMGYPGKVHTYTLTFGTDNNGIQLKFMGTTTIRCYVTNCSLDLFTQMVSTGMYNRHEQWFQMLQQSGFIHVEHQEDLDSAVKKAETLLVQLRPVLPNLWQISMAPEDPTKRTDITFQMDMTNSYVTYWEGFEI